MLLLALLSVLTGCQDVALSTLEYAPEADITSHQPGDVVLEGYAETLRGYVRDKDHDALDLAAAWYLGSSTLCSPTAPASDGTTTCTWTPDAGVHELRLEVSDPDGQVELAEVSLSALATEEPTAVIVGPYPGVGYSDQVELDFEGYVDDAEDDPQDLVVWWESSLDGVLSIDVTPDGGGNVAGTGSLSAGEHELSLHVEDLTGKTAVDTVDITVLGCDLSTFYVDDDGDGWGGEPVEACELPSGAVEQAGDCDDADEAVNPDAVDVCDDEVDSDCDGSVEDGCDRLFFLSDASGEVEIWTAEADGSELAELSGVDHDDLRAPTVSPDGSTVAVILYAGAVSLVDVASGATTASWDVQGMHAHALSWLDDATVLFGSTEGVRGLDVATGAVSTIVENPGYDALYRPAASSDRASVAALAYNTNGHFQGLWEVDLATGKGVLFSALQVCETGAPSYSPDDSLVAYTHHGTCDGDDDEGDHLMLLDRTSGQTELLLDLDASGYSTNNHPTPWSADGSTLYVSVYDGVTWSILAVDAQTGDWGVVLEDETTSYWSVDAAW